VIGFLAYLEPKLWLTNQKLDILNLFEYKSHYFQEVRCDLYTRCDMHMYAVTVCVLS